MQLPGKHFDRDFNFGRLYSDCTVYASVGKPEQK